MVINKQISMWLFIYFSISGCSTGKVIDDPSKLGDTGKSNSILIGYDITVGVVERHNTANSLEIRACDKAMNGAIVKNSADCFVFPAIYTGAIEQQGTPYETYRAAGSDVYQKKYGNYEINEITYKVLIGKIPEQVCTESKTPAKEGKKTLTITNCRTVFKDKFKNYTVALSEPILFEIEPGDGCYGGRHELDVNMNKLNSQAGTMKLDSINTDELPVQLRGKVQELVQKICPSSSDSV